MRKFLTYLKWDLNGFIILRGILKIGQLLVTCGIWELPRRWYLMGLLRLFCWFSACSELELGGKAGWWPDLEGTQTEQGWKKGEEKLFLTHLLYFQPSAEKRILVHFNLLAAIFCSSVCRKWGRLFSITTWLIFLSVSSSDRAAVNDIFELSTLCPCPELLFTFVLCVRASPCSRHAWCLCRALPALLARPPEPRAFVRGLVAPN